MTDDGRATGGPSRGAGPWPAFDVRLLEILVCPVTKASLDYDPEREELISRAARLVFPIRDGVPLMSVETARPLDDEVA